MIIKLRKKYKNGKNPLQLVFMKGCKKTFKILGWTKEWKWLNVFGLIIIIDNRDTYKLHTFKEV